MSLLSIARSLEFLSSKTRSLTIYASVQAAIDQLHARAEIGDDVLGRLDAEREPYEVGRNARLVPGLVTPTGLEPVFSP
jgi:hypothetical protein